DFLGAGFCLFFTKLQVLIARAQSQVGSGELLVALQESPVDAMQPLHLCCQPRDLGLLALGSCLHFIPGVSLLCQRYVMLVRRGACTLLVLLHLFSDVPNQHQHQRYVLCVLRSHLAVCCLYAACIGEALPSGGPFALWEGIACGGFVSWCLFAI